MAKKLKVGVIGVGALGKHHTRLYKECSGVELRGIYDSNIETAKKVSAEFSVDVFETIDELAMQVDGLSVAVPTDIHFDVVLKLLDMNKHILVEKPITDTVEKGEQLVKKALDKNLILQVGHVERFNPVMAYLEKVVDNPVFIESHRLAPYPMARKGMLPRGTEVGVVMDLMIHDIDLLLQLIKSPLVSIDAVGIPVLSATEDIANARLKFKNGCVANMTASRISPEMMRKIRVFQKNTYISLDYMKKDGEIYNVKESGIVRESVPVNDYNALQKELEDFVRCVKSNLDGGSAEPIVTGKHGLRALEVAAEITKQISTANKIN